MKKSFKDFLRDFEGNTKKPKGQPKKEEQPEKESPKKSEETISDVRELVKHKKSE